MRKKITWKWETLAKEINVIVDRNTVRMPNKLFARFLSISFEKWGCLTNFNRQDFLVIYLTFRDIYNWVFAVAKRLIRWDVKIHEYSEQKCQKTEKALIRDVVNCYLSKFDRELCSSGIWICLNGSFFGWSSKLYLEMYKKNLHRNLKILFSDAIMWHLCP